MTTSTSARTRLTPEQRRAQLLDLGLQLLGTRSLEELSIDVLAEEAGISRGLMYHYFGSKLGFYEAVVQHAADDLYARTAPPPDGEPLERLLACLTAYVDYVIDNTVGYRSLVRAASGGNDAVRAIYERTFTAMGERFFSVDAGTSASSSSRVSALAPGASAAFSTTVMAESMARALSALEKPFSSSQLLSSL